MQTPQKIAFGSIVIGIVVLMMKYLAYWVTGSVALLSDAMESIVNVATAVAALFAIRVAAKPADENHHYGHHKAELMSAAIEGALIIVAALAILWQAYLAFITPRLIEDAGLGLTINIAAGLINGIWCFVLIRAGRKYRSPALYADGKHLLSDVISSLGVTIGVVCAVYFSLPWLDPVLAILVALNILWSGWQIIRASLHGLMDEAMSEADLEKIRLIIAENGAGAVQAHDLRTRHDGHVQYIDFHLIVPGDMTVSASHELCDRIESAIIAQFPHANPQIHVEPEEKAKRDAIEIQAEHAS
jgi:cation diffusion facilitator family transporter